MNRKPNPLGLRDSKHGKRLPTYRQIDNWRRAGLFGDHHVGLGSGSRDAWTDDEIEALAALNELSEQMATLDLHLSNKMVKSAWPQLVSGMRVTFTFSAQSTRTAAINIKIGDRVESLLHHPRKYVGTVVEVNGPWLIIHFDGRNDTTRMCASDVELIELKKDKTQS